MNPTRKKLTLPSGATCIVRRLNARDCVSLRNIPAAFADNESTREPSEEQIQYGVKFVEIILSKCCSALSCPDGTKLIITTKPLDQLAPNEICVDELDQADAEAITQTVLELSNMGKEAAATAKPFPEEQKTPGDNSRTGEDVRQTPA